MIRRAPGRRAAADSFEHLAVHFDEQPKGHPGIGGSAPSIRIMLYVRGAIDLMWQHANMFMGPEVMLATQDVQVDGVNQRVVKGVAGLRRVDHVTGRDGSEAAWELVEIAAVEKYGPAMFNLALAAALEHDMGVVPDRSHRSRDFARLLRTSRRTQNYTTERLVAGLASGSRPQGPDVDSIYFPAPHLEAEFVQRLDGLRSHGDDERGGLAWDNYDKAITPESHMRWMDAAYETFFRSIYRRRE